ncbi:MAG: bifunctional hydroxymethylpyrimidine kinase/phosphomethylpyrimidine kinase [Chromatiales bacterium]
MPRISSGHPPVVLAIGGHDPTGGAGIQADFETIHSLGGRPITLITALTAQNTQRFEGCMAVEVAALRRQAELLLQDIEPRAIKIGLVPSTAIAEVVGSLSASTAAAPVVLDPVLAAGTGTAIADEATVKALRSLLPQVTVITPNSHEARRLSGEEALDVAAERLLALGCRHVLVTGTHEPSATVDNTLYSETRRSTWSWERLPQVYHGSGCTLASALATLLGYGFDIEAAATLAQEYTWRTLKEAQLIGHGQWHPRRMPDERFIG